MTARTSAVLGHRIDGPETAPPLVLLHAIATHADLWAPQVAAWSSQFRVVRIDLPGHGTSAAPAHPQEEGLHAYAVQVRRVLDHLGIERAGIVGLSLGGMVAQAVALAFPERTAALVLAHTGARTAPAVRELWTRRLAQFDEEGLDAQVGSTLERWFTRDFAQRSPLTLEWVARQIRATSPEGYAAAIRAIQGLDHAARLGEIRVPTLVVAGREDTAVPPTVGAELAAAVPGARFLVLEDAAHLSSVEQPVAFTESVGAFLMGAVQDAF